MTPKEAYEVRKAERAKLKDLEHQTRSRTETVMILDIVDRFVVAVEQIADVLSAPKMPLGTLSPTQGCVCPAGAEIGCGSTGCPRRRFTGFPATC